MFRVIFFGLIIFLNTMGFSDDSPKIKAALKFVLNNEGMVSRFGHKEILLVQITKNKNLKDFTPITPLRDLIHLYLTGTGVENLSFLKSFKKLKTLDISYTEVVDISPLNTLRDLDSLALDGLQIKSLDSIKHLNKLEELSFCDTLVSDISALKRFRKLKYLDISGLEIKEIDSLLNLKKLEEVTLPKNIDVKLLDKFKKKHPKCKIDLR